MMHELSLNYKVAGFKDVASFP